jgi:hypothetical protein
MRTGIDARRRRWGDRRSLTSNSSVNSPLRERDTHSPPGLTLQFAQKNTIGYILAGDRINGTPPQAGLAHSSSVKNLIID